MVKLFRYLLFSGFLSVMSQANAASTTCTEWPLWSAYLQRFVQADGRVLDQTGEPDFTTSESAAYTLFFSLVNNDRERFAILLKWVQFNLAQGDLGAMLPAWHWGRKAAGKWQILDANSATDADMWFAYSLLQAGRLWQEPGYTSIGLRMLEQIKANELTTLPAQGPMMLPGPQGFTDGVLSWRINPSYQPLQLLRAFAVFDPLGPWDDMARNTVQMMKAVSPLGLAPDWVLYQSGKGWLPDWQTKSVGSYDAIRVYLWTGMLDDAEPLKPALLQSLSGMQRLLLKKNGALMEKIQTQSGQAAGQAPQGFSAALLPYLQALHDTKNLAAQRRRLDEKKNGNLIGEAPVYYDQMLALFGQGWIEQRFRFSASGQLIPAWPPRCALQ